MFHQSVNSALLPPLTAVVPVLFTARVPILKTQSELNSPTNGLTTPPPLATLKNWGTSPST
jgi:hypothetical protein